MLRPQSVREEEALSQVQTQKTYSDPLKQTAVITVDVLNTHHSVHSVVEMVIDRAPSIIFSSMVRTIASVLSLVQATNQDFNIVSQKTPLCSELLGQFSSVFTIFPAKTLYLWRQFPKQIHHSSRHGKDDEHRYYKTVQKSIFLTSSRSFQTLRIRDVVATTKRGTRV